jgi:hypothetical protein
VLLAKLRMGVSVCELVGNNMKATWKDQASPIWKVNN